MPESGVLERIEALVRDVLVPLEPELEETNEVPTAALSAMKAAGVFGLSIPTEFGGQGLTMVQEVDAVRELGRAAAAFRSIAGISIGVGSQAIVRFGTVEQRARWLPGIASGEVLTSFALTEDDAGSDAAALRARAERTAAGWRLTARKKWVTNAPLAHLVTVIAATHRERLPHNRHLSAFVVSLDSDGVSIKPRRTLIGQRGAYWADVDFDGVELTDDCLIGEVGGGFDVMHALLERSRLQVSALAAGQAVRLIDEMLEHTMHREQFGRPLAEFELIQAMLADSFAESCAIDAMVRDTAARFDAGEPVSARASATKLFSSEAVGRIADRAVQALGARGIEHGHPVERIYRDVRLFRFIEGTTQMQQINVARDMVRGRRVLKEKI